MKKKNWIVVALCIAIVGMGIGFAALAQNLQISATANITGEWDVRIWQGAPMRGEGHTFTDYPSFDIYGTSISFEVDLKYPGAFAEFDFTVQNFGNIPAALSSVTGLNAANNAEPSEIKYSVRVMNFGNLATFETDSNDFDRNDYILNPGGPFHIVQIRVEWVANPDGESVIPDEKSKTATINLNYVQHT